MRLRRISAAVGAIAVSAAATLLSVGAGQASAAPNFQMPFKCGYTATAATFGDHNPQLSVDWQKSGITGDAVLASAGGTVSVVGDEGGDSYGKWIEIDHGGGWTTRYAHLSAQGVSKGEKVSAGKKIGEAGATGGVSGPHVHYEQNLNGDTQKAVINGKNVPYYGHTDFTSKNCGGNGNPHTPEEVCGSGFSVIDQKGLSGKGSAFLLYNGDSGKNCVATIKDSKIGKKSAASAFLEVKGADRATDKGKFSYYAGPVKKAAAGKCVKWGGSVDDKSYASKFEHCG